MTNKVHMMGRSSKISLILIFTLLLSITQVYVFDYTAAAATTIGDGTSPSNKNVAQSSTNNAVSTFTLQTSSGTDTVTQILVRRGGTGAASDVPANGVKIYQDNDNNNEYSVGDLLKGQASFSGTDATFNAINISVSTTQVKYLITYNIAAGATVGNTLTGYVSSATATAVVNNDDADATLTITAGCTRSNPTVEIVPGTRIIAKGASITYSVRVTNNDTAACFSTSFTLSTANNPAVPNANFSASALTSAVTGALAPGAVWTTILTHTATAGAVNGSTLQTTISTLASANGHTITPSNQVTTTVGGTALGTGDGTTLKRAPYETCHSCHKTDSNARTDVNSIKMHSAEWLGTCSNLIYTNRTDCTANSGTWTTKWGAGWGITGGQYGVFLCTTCHTAHDTRNIYLIKETVTAPSGSFPGGTVDFRIKTGNPGDVGTMGDDSVAHNPSTRVCEVCHSRNKYHNSDRALNTDNTHFNAQDCSACHSHKNAFGHGGGGGTGCGTSTTCHGRRQSHTTHVSGQILSLDCSECHNTNNFPQFKDGQNLAGTTVCTNCHSANGVSAAKQYWDYPGSSLQTAGSWSVVLGEKSFCGSCHDATPGKTEPYPSTGGDSALNILGNDTTYGFYVTGHGKASGNYAGLSYQDTASSGNPAGNRKCSDCHNLQTAHFNNTQKRLQGGNDQNNSNCNLCHSTGGPADANPKFYTNSPDYENSAHKNKLCTECHDVHGIINWSAPTYTGMTKGNKQSLCYQCHKDPASGGIQNNAISGASLADDIQQAFGMGVKHDLGTSFSIGTGSYTLQCTSCHNVHVVTGKYWEADLDKSPVSRFTNNTTVWGASTGQKMSDYAGSGTYKTPSGDIFSGSQLPDYATFCLDCHGQPAGHANFGINWNGDMHGKRSANQPSGYGTCPNWFACGKAFGWDGDDCVGDQATCWPVIPRGAGDQLFSREAYTHTERIAGANFTLSCTDCHESHGSGVSSMLRSNPNGGTGTVIWNTMCNNCHYYYSDWHAGMSCGNASCHVENSIHRADNMGGSGGTRAFNPDLVLWYRFENNLNDSSSTWQMDGKWYSTSGSYAAGKSGQAVVLGNGQTVQVGTENSYWSTDEGRHGTWKYTEMKYSTTLETWVYPTDNANSEYAIFNKHVGVSSNGGYAFTLKKVSGTLRATFTMAADNNGGAQDGRAGVRGAYSSVSIPLNKWTHVAATFDTSGADRNPSDPSVGRVRIYVNGEDVTTSDSSGNNMQPGAGETSMYAYSENSPWNQGICYNGTWCASEFSIGGFDWETTNFMGRIDEAKVWNITKNAAYFSSYDSQAGPYISSVGGLIGNNQLTVKFSEGVYTNTGASGALVSGDFVLTDTGGNNPRTITGVTHTAGSSTATVTMSQPLTAADFDADTIAAVSNAIYDEYNNAAGTDAVTIVMSSQSPCPASPVSIQLNEPAGSTYVMDTQSKLYGAVNGGAAALTGSAFSGGGDDSGRYIMFDYNTTCLQATTAMTIETRIKPTGIPNDTTTNYRRRILARDSDGNFQISVWRDNSAYPGLYNAPSGEASIALWISPVNVYGGNTWKPVLTNYTGAANGSENNCPIVSDHWYQVKAVWDTNKPGGTPEQFFQPADIYIEDQGTDGLGAGKNWTGLINCTDTDQSLKTDAVKFYTGDQINRANGTFAIGANRGNPANNLFNGLIDLIIWKDSVD